MPKKSPYSSAAREQPVKINAPAAPDPPSVA